MTSISQVINKILCKIYAFVWSYWLDEKDIIVKVIGIKTAYIDRHGQRVKSSPMIWKTAKNKWRKIKYLMRIN